jgi:DNA invertase Pin-like site-specific DNA recombinase
MLIHRWVWEQINGPIPKGMVIMHTCDNPPCFLYDHLRLGTQAENMADMRAKGRWKPNPNGRRKLTVEQVAEIRAALAAGETQQRIAERYGVWQSNISWIKRGKTWTDAS